MEKQVVGKNLGKEMDDATGGRTVLLPETPGTRPGDVGSTPILHTNNQDLPPPRDKAADTRNVDEPHLLFTKKEVQTMIDAAIRNLQAEPSPNFRRPVAAIWLLD